MESIEAALSAVLEQASPRPVVDCSLAGSLGLVLAGDALSDVDSPPFDKSLMDGFAVRFADLSSLPARLTVIEEVMAGQVPARAVGQGEATRIMTGAPVPEGADTVIPVEQTHYDATTRSVEIVAAPSSAGAAILRRGSSLRAGSPVATEGTCIRPQEIAALAEFGHSTVRVRPRPRIAVLATGDELVPCHQQPGPGQIRNTNEPMLVAQIQQAGGEAVPLGIARDNRPDLAAKIAQGLSCDALLLSGGVSAGVLDLVPSELASAGVQEVFHKIPLRPGRPLWFGLRRTTDADGETASSSAISPCLVFGLPGNPVSSMVCFELFVRPAIRTLLGDPQPGPHRLQATLAAPHSARGDRTTCHPARLQVGPNGWTAAPVPWIGSADLQATTRANGLAVFPPGTRDWQPGEAVDVICWDVLPGGL
ncbi:MAG: molybdopterin molybdotransferase MoeA [Planctomycetaceae bacterium]|nr:molybdopterin molybdotransferase MoeA [Planctomycetaceae bacterium]